MQTLTKRISAQKFITGTLLNAPVLVLGNSDHSLTGA